MERRILFSSGKVQVSKGMLAWNVPKSEDKQLSWNVVENV